MIFLLMLVKVMSNLKKKKKMVSRNTNRWVDCETVMQHKERNQTKYWDITEH